MPRFNGKGQPRAKSFAGIPRIVMDSTDFRSLHGNAVKLLLALAYQYRGSNNGDLTAAFSVMREKFGFSSKATLAKALKALLSTNLIMQTRMHQFMNPGRKCALYALTWQPIDECKGKLDCNPTNTPPRKFSMERNK